MKVSEIIHALEKLAPSGTAEKWDNVGLLAGDPQWSTKGAVVSVDLTQEAIALARKKGFNLIVNHHPCIFPKSRGLARVVPGTGVSSLVFEALRHGIAVASYHTNFDQCAMEVVEAISSRLGAKPKGRLLESSEGSLTKLVVFVPSTHVETLRDALSQAGAGHIGNYDSCTFGVPGEGTFRGLSQAKPFIGKAGRLEKAQEIRLETIFPRGLKKQVLAAMRAAHPYEEIAYDLYAVEQGPAQKGLIRGLGYGFWGDLPKAVPFKAFSGKVARLFKTQGFLLTDPAPKKVKRIAFTPGKGASFVDAAAAAGCDLLITGEVGYHGALDGKHKGLAVLELGHRESEYFYLQTMTGWLNGLGIKAAALNLKTQKVWS